MKQPFTLYKRPTTKKNKYIYYVQFRDSEGNRLTAVSSGQTSKSAAVVWAYERLKEGSINSIKDPKFSVFAENWFVWGKCPYLEKRLNRGTYSRSYADYQRAILKNHILPYLANLKLSEITVKQIENWLLSVKEVHSSATANRALSVLKIMFKEAFRLSAIHKDSASLVQKLQERSKEAGILTIDEARSLLNPKSVTSLWKNHLKHYCINLIACTTGMRLGEIQALRLQDYHKDHITVSYSWDRKYGLKHPKCKSFRAISIPKYVSSPLEEQILESREFKPDDLIFHGKLKNKAIDHKDIVKQLYLALSKIGISEEQRKKRGISFHSWRHFFNTYMRRKVPDSILQKVTGHRTMRMTELYDHQQLEDLEEIREVQETMII